MGAGVIVGDGDVGAVVVGCKVIVGAGVGISFMSQSGRKLKHSNPFGQSILRPDWCEIEMPRFQQYKKKHKDLQDNATRECS